VSQKTRNGQLIDPAREDTPFEIAISVLLYCELKEQRGCQKDCGIL
jgi:hypothetical protein